VAIATRVRKELAAALTAQGIPAFPALPHAITPPMVAFQAGDPYIRIDRIGATLQVEVQLRASMIVPTLDGTGSLEQLEELIDATLLALPPDVFASEVSAPRVDRLGEAQGAVLIADLDLTTYGKE